MRIVEDSNIYGECFIFITMYHDANGVDDDQLNQ